VVLATDQTRRAQRQRSTVDVGAELVTKQYPPDGFRAELAKARLLAAASSPASGLARGVFSAPAVLDVDEVRHTITYQRLDCSHDLLDVVADPGRSQDAILHILSRVGGCLAAIHEIAAPAEPTVVQRRSDLFTAALARQPGCPEPGDTTDSQVLQHGDFGFTNVFVGPDGEITIIDPSPNGYTSVHPLNVDVPELDLAVLCSHTVGRVASPRALARTYRYGGHMVDAIVDGYESAGARLDRERLRRFTLASIHAVIAYRSPGSRAHRRAALRPLSSLLARNLS
jgi:hypothetical protein